jgi:hypothetical protein
MSKPAFSQKYLNAVNDLAAWYNCGLGEIVQITKNKWSIKYTSKSGQSSSWSHEKGIPATQLRAFIDGATGGMAHGKVMRRCVEKERDEAINELKQLQSGYVISTLAECGASEIADELAKRGREGEIDLTERFWDVMEPEGYQIKEKAEQNDLQVVDEDELKQQAEELADAMIEKSPLLDLAAKVAYARTEADRTYDLSMLRHELDRSHNVHHQWVM